MIRTISCIVFAAVLGGGGCNTSGTNQATQGPATSAAQVADKEQVSRRIGEYFGKSVTPGVTLRVTDLAPAHHVAEVVDGVDLVHPLGFLRAVYEADHRIEVVGDVLVVEGARCHLAVAVEGLVLVAPLPEEAGWRLAEVDA